MSTTVLQSISAWLGSTLSVSLGFVAAIALIPLLLVQVLLEAYYGPEPVQQSRLVRAGTVLLLVVFGVGAALRVAQILSAP
jgi:hypothetical protein